MVSRPVQRRSFALDFFLTGCPATSWNLLICRHRVTAAGIRNRIARWVAREFVSELVRYRLEKLDGRWRLQFAIDHAAFERLSGRRVDWGTQQVVAGQSGQQHMERMFRGLHDGNRPGREPSRLQR